MCENSVRDQISRRAVGPHDLEVLVVLVIPGHRRDFAVRRIEIEAGVVIFP